MDCNLSLLTFGVDVTCWCQAPATRCRTGQCQMPPSAQCRCNVCVNDFPSAVPHTPSSSIPLAATELSDGLAAQLGDATCSCAPSHLCWTGQRVEAALNRYCRSRTPQHHPTIKPNLLEAWSHMPPTSSKQTQHQRTMPAYERLSSALTLCPVTMQLNNSLSDQSRGQQMQQPKCT